MTRVSVIVGAFFVALGLAPISAEAQLISACVNNSSGGVRIVAPNATCSNNEHSLVWGSGALAGADYQCVVSQTIAPGNALNFQPGVSFGSGISTTGTPLFGSFVLQQGIYQVHLSGSGFTKSSIGDFIIDLLLNNQAVAAYIVVPDVNAGVFNIVGGDRLISVASNTVLALALALSSPTVTTGFCELVITKLQ